MENLHCLRVLSKATALRNSIVVLSSESSSCKRGEDSGAKKLCLKKPSVFDFHVFPFKNVVLGLFNHWLDKIVLLTGIHGLRDLILAPLAGPPVESHALANNPVECPTDLLHWGGRVTSVTVDHIHVVESQVRKRLPHAFNHVFSVQSPRVWD